ncbi:hypothetical protein GCM10023405_24710 [Streptomonospora salina]
MSARRLAVKGGGPVTPATERPGVGPPGEDALFAIDQTGQWIRSADTKAGLLGAALSVLATGVAAEAAKSGVPVLDAASVRESLSGWLLIILAAFLVIAIALTVKTVSPRISTPRYRSRYSWPWLNAMDPMELSRLGSTNSRHEAWVQAIYLAGVAEAKHRSLRLALRFFAAAGVLFLLWSALR